MTRFLPILLACGCAILQKPTVADALCLGGGVAMTQVQTAPGALPGVSIDLHQCFEDIPVDGPLTCEQAAKVAQYVTYLSAVAAVATRELSDETRTYSISLPLVPLAECPQP